MPAADRTLVIQPLPGIGDMIWNLPFIHAIARQAPDRRVSILTKPRSRADQLLAHDAAVDEILWLERGGGRHDGIAGLFRLAGDLRRRRFGTVWVLHQSVRYALCARLAGIPRRIGYGSGRQAWFLSRGMGLPAPAGSAHPIVNGRALLAHLGVEVRDDDLRLPTSPERCAALREHWAPLAEGVNVVLGIGSSEAYKKWPAERFVELMRRLGAAVRCRFYLFGGGPAERQEADRLLEQVRAAGVDAVSAIDLALGDAIHLFRLLDLYVGNDTGFLNVAAALEIPAVGIFGGSPPLDYSPCIHAVLPAQGALQAYDASGAGIQSITVDTVFDAVMAVLPRRDAGGA